MPETNDGVEKKEVAPIEAAEGEGDKDSVVEELKTQIADLESQSGEKDSLIGSLKRDLKKAEKAQEKPKGEEKGTPEKNQSDDKELLQKVLLRTANITDEEEVELALETSEKWNVSVDKLVDDEDFKVKLERFREAKANTKATSKVKGGPAKTDAKNTAEYWAAKGQPPTREQVPDRKLRAKIARAMMKDQKSGKTFYSD